MLRYVKSNLKPHQQEPWKMAKKELDLLLRPCPGSLGSWPQAQVPASGRPSKGLHPELDLQRPLVPFSWALCCPCRLCFLSQSHPRPSKSNHSPNPAQLGPVLANLILALILAFHLNLRFSSTSPLLIHHQVNFEISLNHSRRVFLSE